MAGKLELEVATPDRQVVAMEVDEVVLPSVEGYLGVLPGHAALLAILDAGELSYRVGNERRYLALSGGFVEVLRDQVSVLADASEKPDEIDLQRAERSRERARGALEDSGTSPDDFRRAEVRLKRALARIHVHGRS